MSITRSQITRKALHNEIDYTKNFFTDEIREDKFKEALDELTMDIDFPSLRKIWGHYGKSSTTFDITNPSGTTFRYTYSSGSAPLFTTNNAAIGRTFVIKGLDFAADNNLTSVLTNVDETYFEIDNASGVVESSKGLKSGYIIDNAILGVNDVCDYEMPSDFQKFSGTVLVGNSSYDPIKEDESAMESNFDRNSIYIEDSRFVLTPAPSNASIIRLPYYASHPALDDNTPLKLPDEAETALIRGVMFLFAEMDDAVSSQETAAIFQLYERAKTRLDNFIKTRRLNGRRDIFNDAYDDMFDIS